MTDHLEHGEFRARTGQLQDDADPGPPRPAAVRRVVAEHRRSGERGTRHFGALKNTTFVPSGVDLTGPADPDWGKVYENDAPIPAKPSAQDGE